VRITSRYFVNGGSSLYYEEAGAGRACVLIHANMLDCRMWDFNFLPLASGARVIRYDMRGFGKSAPSDGRMGAAVADLRGLLDYLSVEKAVICGTSMGGVVATHFALLHPERTAGLILSDSDLSGFPISAELAQPILDTHRALDDGDTARAVEIWLNHALLLPTRRYPAAWELLNRIVSEYTWHNWLSGRTYLIDPPALGRLHEINAPTLILTGAEDLPRFHAIADTLARAIPHCRRLTLPATAHLPSMEAPEVFNALLRDFLRDRQD
jgi:pimeloyl-ACP methyl ester carboxylesterase